MRFFYWGTWSVLAGLSIYFLAIFVSILRLLALKHGLFVLTIQRMLWLSGLPTTIGTILMAFDLGLMLPLKRRLARRATREFTEAPALTVALTAYNDEASIFDSVRDFLSHPL